MKKSSTDLKLKKSEILFEDNHLIIINKKPGILVQGDITGDISCLLYTSPSPRDVEESRMPSSA